MHSAVMRDAGIAAFLLDDHKKLHTWWLGAAVVLAAAVGLWSHPLYGHRKKAQA